MADVFISYNREDQNRARAIAGALEAEGLSVWWDSNLRAGQSYDEVTEKNLREAGAVVVLWSKRSVNSKWVRAEATIGERCSTLVPAMIDECDRPLRFELVQTADLINWRGDRNDANWRAFVHDIQAAIGHHGSAAPQQSATGCRRRPTCRSALPRRSSRRRRSCRSRRRSTARSCCARRGRRQAGRG